MSLDGNKALVRSFLEAAVSGNLARMDALMTADATWWLLPSIRDGGLHTKEQFFAMLPMVWANLEGPLRLNFLDFTAEDDRVSVTFTGQARTKSGKLYDNNYHALFVIHDGRIASAREYFDTAHVNEIFGG